MHTPVVVCVDLSVDSSLPAEVFSSAVKCDTQRQTLAQGNDQMSEFYPIDLVQLDQRNVQPLPDIQTWPCLKIARRGLWTCGCVLILLGVTVVCRHLYVQNLVSTIEQHGGAISDDEIVYFWGPSFVTFNIPGNRVVPSDADAKSICQALSRFHRLDRVDLTGTALGDPFFIELSQRCHIPMIQLRHTRCGDLGVQALANNGATRELYLEGLALSEETLSLLDRRGIRYVR